MTDASALPEGPCSPEIDRFQSRLTELLNRPPGRDRTHALGEFLRDAATTLMRAGCDVAEQRPVLLPAALQILLCHSTDEPTKRELLRWVDTLV